MMADTDAGVSTPQVQSTAISLSNQATLVIERPYGYLVTKNYNDMNLALHSSDLDRSGPDGAVIRGTIRNTNAEEIAFSMIVFNLFDASGNQIGNAYASIDFLAPRTNWKFVTDPIPLSNLQFYRVAHILTSSNGSGL